MISRNVVFYCPVSYHGLLESIVNELGLITMGQSLLCMVYTRLLQWMTHGLLHRHGVVGCYVNEGQDGGYIQPPYCTSGAEGGCRGPGWRARRAAGPSSPASPPPPPIYKAQAARSESIRPGQSAPGKVPGQPAPRVLAVATIYGW